MGDTLIDSGRASPNLGDYRWERHFVDVSLATGSGSSTLSYDESFDDGTTVSVHVTGPEDGDWYASAAGATQATINCDNSNAADGTYTAMVLVIGAEE